MNGSKTCNSAGCFTVNQIKEHWEGICLKSLWLCLNPYISWTPTCITHVQRRSRTEFFTVMFEITWWLITIRASYSVLDMVIYISYIHAWDAMNSMIPANSEVEAGEKITEIKMYSQLLVKTAPLLSIENDMNTRCKSLQIKQYMVDNNPYIDTKHYGLLSSHWWGVLSVVRACGIWVK